MFDIQNPKLTKEQKKHLEMLEMLFDVYNITTPPTAKGFDITRPTFSEIDAPRGFYSLEWKFLDIGMFSFWVWDNGVYDFGLYYLDKNQKQDWYKSYTALFYGHDQTGLIDKDAFGLVAEFFRKVEDVSS